MSTQRWPLQPFVAPRATKCCTVARRPSSYTSRVQDVGLALSGGGSRAAAFHRGTLHALHEIGIADRLRSVSTVSGGSIFGAAWMAARARGVSDHDFLTRMKEILSRGFLAPALFNVRALKILWPTFSRTHRLAETFDEILSGGVPLSKLPESPVLILNTAVLNHGQVGRFSRGGFSCQDVGAGQDGHYPEHSLHPSVTLGFATAASAAFPFGLPPVKLHPKKIGNGSVEFTGQLTGHPYLLITDGGVLENLGVQTLLRSSRFGATHIVVSDAGTAEAGWRPGRPGRRLRNAAVFALSADTLERLVGVMNNKQNRSMRQLVVEELAPGPPPSSRRSILIVRIAQQWNELLLGIPPWRLAALRSGKPPPTERSVDAVQSYLAACGIDLSRARALYDEMGGEDGVAAANAVATKINGLETTTLDLLALHARWQMHAVASIYGVG